MHTSHAQVHCYQSEAISCKEREEKEKNETKPQQIKPTPKCILIDASSILHIPAVRRWRDLQAHQEEINQPNRPCFIQPERPNKYPEPSHRSDYSTQPSSIYVYVPPRGRWGGQYVSTSWMHIQLSLYWESLLNSSVNILVQIIILFNFHYCLCEFVLRLTL